MKTAAWIISVIGVLVLTVTGYGWAQATVPISPGTADGKGLVISGCPTFSWAEVTEATGYKVVVFANYADQLPMYYEDIEATQTPVLEHDIPVRALSWTPSADQGLCAGSYVWYVAAVQWGEVLEWSEGLVFKVDALAGLDAAAGKCLGVPADTTGADNNNEPHSEVAIIESQNPIGTLSLEQIISTEVTKESSFKSTKNDKAIGGTSALGPITMGTEGASNTFYGQGAGSSIEGNRQATFIGVDAGYSNTTAFYNTFVGKAAGYSNDTGANNTLIGQAAGYHNTTGGDNTFIGKSAGYSNVNGVNNTFIGRSAGFSNIVGWSTTFIGNEAGFSNTTGPANTFLGKSAGYHNTTGQSNIFIGKDAGYNNTTGNANTFIGTLTGESNVNGSGNTFLGRNAGHQNISGGGNVFLGSYAGYYETGSNKLYIDNTSTSYPLIYGELDNNIVKIHGELQMIASTSPSDKRLKRDIKPLQSSLNKIQALQGVSYQWRTEEYTEWGFKKTKQIGLVAQNVEDVIPELVSTDRKGYKAVSYDKLTAILVEAVKELKAENDQLKAKTEHQQAQIDELRALIQ